MMISFSLRTRSQPPANHSRAVVVDYKFGGREPERYRRQVLEYLALLRQMGYTETEGYLWYVKLGRIEKVEE